MARHATHGADPWRTVAGNAANSQENMGFCGYAKRTECVQKLYVQIYISGVSSGASRENLDAPLTIFAGLAFRAQHQGSARTSGWAQ